MPGLSAFTDRPLMPCASQFFKALGRQGSFIQAAEVAIRHFEEIAPTDQAAFATFFKAQASRYGLSIGIKAFHQTRSSAAKWFIVEVSQVWDTFSRALKDEYRKYKQPAKWKATDNHTTLTPFQQLLFNLPKPSAQAIAAEPEYQILQY
ncbi:MAG: hypothetical protein WCO56_27990 [Verrucomicrobiota bacterium]